MFACPAWADDATGDDQGTPDASPQPLKDPGEPDRFKVKPVPDPVIARRVREGLTATKRPEVQRVRLLVEKGVVTMRGTVRTHQEKALAEAVARTLPGVRGVKSEIKLQSGFRPQVTHGDRRSLIQIAADEKLRKTVIRRLMRVPGVRPSQLQVEVQCGVAVVGGVVSSAIEAQRVRHSLTYVNDLHSFVLNLYVENEEP